MWEGNRIHRTLGEDARDEALPLTDALHLHGNRVDGLIETGEAVHQFLGNGAHGHCTATPEPARVGDGEREEHDDDEDPAQDEHFLGRTGPDVRWVRHHCTRYRGGLRDFGVRGGNLLVERGDARVHFSDVLLEASTDWPRSVARLELTGEVTPLILE